MDYAKITLTMSAVQGEFLAGSLRDLLEGDRLGMVALEDEERLAAQLTLEQVEDALGIHVRPLESFDQIKG